MYYTLLDPRKVLNVSCFDEDSVGERLCGGIVACLQCCANRVKFNGSEKQILPGYIPNYPDIPKNIQTKQYLIEIFPKICTLMLLILP